MINNQLIFDLKANISFDRRNFYVSNANKDTVQLLNSWPDWPTKSLAIIGPAGSGKSHLVSYWAEEAEAIVVKAQDILLAEVPTLSEYSAIVVEDCDKLHSNSRHTDCRKDREQAILHLLNLISQKLSYTVLTGSSFPAYWSIKLQDLASRIATFPVAELAVPGDELLMAVMLKQFEDRQIKVKPGLISFVCSRIDRSFEAVQEFVEGIDKFTLTEKREVTIPAASKVLKNLYAID